MTFFPFAFILFHILIQLRGINSAFFREIFCPFFCDTLLFINTCDVKWLKKFPSIEFAIIGNNFIVHENFPQIVAQLSQTTTLMEGKYFFYYLIYYCCLWLLLVCFSWDEAFVSLKRLFGWVGWDFCFVFLFKINLVFIKDENFSKQILKLILISSSIWVMFFVLLLYFVFIGFCFLYWVLFFSILSILSILCIIFSMFGYHFIFVGVST